MHGSSMNEIQESIFFFLIFALSQPVLDRNNVGINFFNFLNFFTIFYFEFSSSGEVGTEFGSRILFSFSAYLIPFWLNVQPEIGFFNFLIFFFSFFRNLLPRVEYERNSGINFFFLFLGLSQPVLDRNNVGINLFNFLNFFTIFYFAFSCLGWVGTEFGSKIFFSLSRPLSSDSG